MAQAQEKVSKSTSGLTDEQIRQETGAPFILSGHRRLADKALQEGQDRVLYLLLGMGDENVAHDHWHPDKAQFLFEVRQQIISELRTETRWPKKYPNFETYRFRSG